MARIIEYNHLMPVEITPYKSEWKDEFRQIAGFLRQVLDNLALRIDHIGSTAVPGLDAKDVIDIQVTVKALDEAVMNALTAAGFTHRADVSGDHLPPGWDEDEAGWRKWLFKPPPGWREVNLHVRIEGAPNQRYPLLFRDFLRSHLLFAQAYARLKWKFAPYMPDRHTYAEVKDPAVDLIYLAAEEWAAQSGWQLPPADA
ncbi:MAG: GrpB family protein [Chloroflexota bacterium]